MPVSSVRSSAAGGVQNWVPLCSVIDTRSSLPWQFDRQFRRICKSLNAITIISPSKLMGRAKLQLIANDLKACDTRPYPAGVRDLSTLLCEPRHRARAISGSRIELNLAVGGERKGISGRMPCSNKRLRWKNGIRRLFPCF
jgi:hypothetical protein